MSERKVKKPRKCRKCEHLIESTAEEIKTHAAACTGK